jgi:hypothetical protein
MPCPELFASYGQRGLHVDKCAGAQVRRLEGRLLEVEVQASSAEEAHAAAQGELQQLRQTLEDSRVAQEKHVQVPPPPASPRPSPGLIVLMMRMALPALSSCVSPYMPVPAKSISQ